MEAFFTDPDDGESYIFGRLPTAKHLVLERRLAVLQGMDLKLYKERPSVAFLQRVCESYGHVVDAATIQDDLEWLDRNGTTLRYVLQQSRVA